MPQAIRHMSIDGYGETLIRQPLKQLNEMFDPDARSTSFVRHDATEGHPKTLKHHRADIAAIQLSEAVPEGIRDEFYTIRNLHLYSWYVYYFTVPATLYAHTLIEKAIMEKCRLSSVPLKNVKGLRKLLGLSIDKCWLRNSHFPLALELTREKMIPATTHSEPPTLRSSPRYSPFGTDYCEHLAKILPPIRNMGAHGEAGLGFPATALHQIEICACIINALFPAPDDMSGR